MNPRTRIAISPTSWARNGPPVGSPPRNGVDDDGCRHFQTAVELIGKRWSSAILLALARGATRFGEIRTLVPGLSDRMLAERMRELQVAKLVERDVVPTTPVQIRYHLTERGTDLIESLQPLVKWRHPGKGRGMPTLTAIPPLKRRPGVLRDDGDGPG
jgi:DNA-binding HxlR family transcriptional regulator